MPAFRGWPAEAIEFYEGLEADNSRAYWREHREVYERCVRAPMEALLEELAAEFGEGRIFQPYRDVRFSADKSPYKTHIGATLPSGGYLQLSADGLGVGAGLWAPDPAALARYRAAVADDRTGRVLEEVVGGLRHAGIEVTAHEVLRRAPRGYPPDHPRIDLLRCKGIIAWRQWPPGPWLGTARAKERVVAFLRASRPLVAWLRENVG